MSLGRQRQFHAREAGPVPRGRSSPAAVPEVVEEVAIEVEVEDAVEVKGVHARKEDDIAQGRNSIDTLGHFWHFWYFGKSWPNWEPHERSRKVESGLTQ